MDRIKIYRGQNQIGGVVTEFRKGDHRILIDFGANLPGSAGEGISDDDLVEKVFGGENSSVLTDAVLFTHYHGDHVGLKNRIPDNIPMYIGKTAKEIMKIVANRVDYLKKKTGHPEDAEMPFINRMQPYWESDRDFSGIKVTPILCDHSAIDSYMFLIEMNGKRILYTGDFRDHGVPGEEAFEDMVRNRIGKVDILVTEGTMVKRIEEEKYNTIHSEEQLRERAKMIFENHKENVVLVSSTNLDSVMNFYLATPGEKAFLCDSYQAEVIKTAIAARHNDFPDTYRYKKRIYVLCPNNNKRYMKNLESITNPYNHKKAFMMADPKKYREKGFVMLARPNRNPDNETGRFEELLNKMDDPYIVYSLWEGYLKHGKAEDPSIIKFMEGHMEKDQHEPLHTSGHAYVETLKKLMDMTDPEYVIPMHTDSTEAFSKRAEFRDYTIWGDPEFIVSDNSQKSIEEMVLEMIRFLQKWGLWDKTRIFACGISYDSDDDWDGDEYKGISFVSLKKDVDPADYVESPSGIDKSFTHVFDMTFEGPLYDILCDGVLQTCYGKIEPAAWDYIFENSDFLEKFLDSGECGTGELLLSNIISEADEGSAYSMWDPLKYDSFDEYLESEEYEKYKEPMWDGEESLTPAYTLFDTYAQYNDFLNGDHKMVRHNPVLWNMSKRMAKNLFFQDLEDDEVTIKGNVARHIKEEFISIFEKYGMDYEMVHNWMLVGYYPKENASLKSETLAGQINEAAERLRLLKVPEKDIAAFINDDIIPGVMQYSDGTIKWISKKVDLRQSRLKKAFRGNMPYFVIVSKGAIPMEAYLYVEENPDERELYRKEIVQNSAECVISAVVFSFPEQDYEYGSITIKLTNEGPIRVE